MQKELTRPFAQTGVIAFCLLLLSSCVHKGEQSAAVPPVPVHVQVVTAGAPSPFSRYVGTVEAVREIPLSSQMAGRVLSVEVKDGERVKKGQVLLTVDSTQAVNAVRSAKATYRQAKDGYERAKQVYSKGAVTDQKMVATSAWVRSWISPRTTCTLRCLRRRSAPSLSVSPARWSVLR